MEGTGRERERETKYVTLPILSLILNIILRMGTRMRSKSTMRNLPQTPKNPWNI